MGIAAVLSNVLQEGALAPLALQQPHLAIRQRHGQHDAGHPGPRADVHQRLGRFQLGQLCRHQRVGQVHVHRPLGFAHRRRRPLVVLERVQNAGQLLLLGGAQRVALGQVSERRGMFHVFLYGETTFAGLFGPGRFTFFCTVKQFVGWQRRSSGN